MRLSPDDITYEFHVGDDAVQSLEREAQGLSRCADAHPIATSEMSDTCEATDPENFYLVLAYHRSRVRAFSYGVIDSQQARAGWLVVEPSYRGFGVATRLHERMVEELSEMGVEVLLQVAATTSGEAVLRSLNYEQVEEGTFQLPL